MSTIVTVFGDVGFMELVTSGVLPMCCVSSTLSACLFSVWIVIICFVNSLTSFVLVFVDRFCIALITPLFYLPCILFRGECGHDAMLRNQVKDA